MSFFKILRTVSAMKSGGEEIVLALVALISTLVDCYESSQRDWIGFLSVPWLVAGIFEKFKIFFIFICWLIPAF